MHRRRLHHLRWSWLGWVWCLLTTLLTKIFIWSSVWSPPNFWAKVAISSLIISNYYFTCLGDEKQIYICWIKKYLLNILFYTASKIKYCWIVVLGHTNIALRSFTELCPWDFWLRIYCLFYLDTDIYTYKNPAYGRQSISRPMRIVAPIPQ